jgi:hypothetical protein
MNVPFNNKITGLSYENSGLNNPVGSLYDFQSTIVPLEELKPVQPYIIANINNPGENIRVGILTNKANLTFRLSPTSEQFVTPVIDNKEYYIFFNYTKIIPMSVISYLDEPLSKFTYLLGDAPILYNNRGLHQLTTRQLREDIEYIIVSKETSQMYRGKYIQMIDTTSNNGALFEFKLTKLPFFVKIVLNDSSCKFYIDKGVSFNRLSQISLLNRERSTLNVDNGRLVNKQKTLRWVKSSSRNRSTTKPESCITILIVAHAFMDKDLTIDRNLMKNVNISLMGGGSDIYGLGGNYRGSHVVVNNIDDDKIKYTIPGDKQRSGMSIDMISRIYPYLLDKYYPIKRKCSEQFFSMFEEITNYLKQFYKLVGIHTFPKHGEYGEDGSNVDFSMVKQHRNPFSIFTSFNEKILHFQPNPYQNCLESETVTRKENCVLKEPEDTRELSFGITMLQSSNPADFTYTLSGMSVNGKNYKNAILTDWTQDDVRNHWTQTILVNTALLPKSVTDYYMGIYNIISRPLDPDGMYDDTSNKTGVTLSQVIELFKYGMGFTNVNIIDYSCNSCRSQLTHMKRALVDVVGSHPSMKLYRKIKNEVRSSMKNPERAVMDIMNPSTQQIVEIVGEKAKTSSYGKRTKKSSIKNTKRGKSFGGKNKTKRMKRLNR